MDMRALMAIAVVTISSMPASALAQDAAETAVILSGSSAQGRANRTLGSAISRSMGSAADSVRAATGSPHATSRSAPSRHHGGAYPPVIASNVDVLENSNAATYGLDNGAQLRTSGTFHPSTAATCARNCPN